MASLKALQDQVDELKRSCPSLLPSFVPRGYHDEALEMIAASEGGSSSELMPDLLSSAAARAPHSCRICSAPGVPSTSASPHVGDGGGSGVLRFTALACADFKSKTVRIERGGFLCGDCRAVSDTWRMIRFSAVKLGASHPQREALVRRLCLHLAVVNHQPEELLVDNDSVVQWAQEVYSRAFALHILASNIPGWKRAGPDGAMVSPGAPGTSARLVRLLLEPAANKAKSSIVGEKRKSKVKGLESEKKKAHIDDSLTPVGKKKSQSAHQASEALPSTPAAPPSAMKRKEGELKARSLTEPRAEFKKDVGREGLIQGGTPLGASGVTGKVKKAKMQPASERKAKAGEGRKDKK